MYTPSGAPNAGQCYPFQISARAAYELYVLVGFPAALGSCGHARAVDHARGVVHVVFSLFFLRNTSSQAVLSSPKVRMQGKSAGHCEDPRQQVAGALPCRLPPRHIKSHPVGPACLIHKCPYDLRPGE